MPLYTFQCNKCGPFEDICAHDACDRATCPSCGGAVMQQFPAPKAVMFRAGYYEHVGPNGVHAETAQELQDACNQHGSYSAYLENSTFKVTRNYDHHDEHKDGKQRQEQREENRASERAAEGDLAIS